MKLFLVILCLSVCACAQATKPDPLDSFLDKERREAELLKMAYNGKPVKDFVAAVAKDDSLTFVGSNVAEFLLGGKDMDVPKLRNTEAIKCPIGLNLDYSDVFGTDTKSNILVALEIMIASCAARGKGTPRDSLDLIRISQTLKQRDIERIRDADASELKEKNDLVTFMVNKRNADVKEAYDSCDKYIDSLRGVIAAQNKEIALYKQADAVPRYSVPSEPSRHSYSPIQCNVQNNGYGSSTVNCYQVPQ